MKKKFLTVLLYSLVLFMVSGESMADNPISSSDTDDKNWTPYSDGAMSFIEFDRSVQGNSLNSPESSVYINLFDRQLDSKVSPSPNINEWESGAMLLLGIGLIGLASFGRRKFNKK